jgi:transcriptional regulator with XRE-family HTH domain
MTWDPQEQRRALGSRIRTWRMRRRLSQAKLASLVGVTQSSLSHYENGKRDLSVTILIRIAQELDVDLEELTGPATAARRRRARRQAS